MHAAPRALQPHGRTGGGARLIVWAGAALFAGSLGYFLFSYAVTFGEIASGAVRPRDILIDGVLFSVFALHHSVFARERVRAWVKRIVTPALERSVYVWAASLMLIAVCAWWRPIPGVVWQIEGALAWLLHGVQLAGVWLTLRSAAVIDIWDLAGVRQAATPSSQLSTREAQLPTPDRGERRAALETGNWEFKTDGPYGWVRHPIYLGWFLIVFPVPVMTTTRLVFAVISSLYVLMAIPLEERSMRRASGGAYDVYMKRVAWKLIPRVY